MAPTHSGTIYICASTAPRDRAFARRLARDVRAMGYTPLVRQSPRDAPQPAPDIARAQAVLIVLSPQLQGSAVARTEYQYALQQQKLIIPLQTQAVPYIPPELAHIQWVDFYALYERGLASLTKTLGGSEEQVLRRARFAALRGRAITVVRSLLATLVWLLRLVLIGNLFGSGWGIVAALPAAFVGFGAEDYRRGEAPGWRIMLARELAGAGIAALLGLLALFVVSSALSSQPDATTTWWTAIGCGFAGGFLAWLFTRLEQRSLSRGRLGARRTLRVLGFCATGGTVLLALITYPVSGQPSYNETRGIITLTTHLTLTDLPVELIIVGILVAVSVLIAAPLEWMFSPVHRVTHARQQLIESTQDGTPAVAAPAAAPVVFISHSSGDNDFAIKLSRNLQQRGIVTWVDRRQLRPGMSWPEEIHTSLERSQVVLLALSPLALSSDWVHQEYEAALAQRKHVIVLRLDEACAAPPELNLAPTIDFSTIYEKGLADVLTALRADQGTLAAARQLLRRRLNSAWLISTVRLFASSYLLLARVLVFAVASFTLLGGFDHLAGVHDLTTYMVIWAGRALPGAALGVFVSLEEQARVAGAKPARWKSLARVVNGFLTGEGFPGVALAGVGGLLLSPVAWLAILFLINLTPGAIFTSNSPQDSTALNLQLTALAVIVGLGIANGSLALLLARSVQRSREQGKELLVMLSRIAQLSARAGIGAVGLAAAIYLLFDSPIGPFGPPQPILGGLGTWLLAGVVLGALTGAIELYFFPVGPSRLVLRKLRAMVQAQQA